MLSTGQMHHFHLQHLKKDNKSMRNKMVQTVTPGRNRRPAAGATKSEMMLLTTMDTALLENSVLKLVPIVQSKVSKHKCLNMKYIGIVAAAELRSMVELLVSQSELFDCLEHVRNHPDFIPLRPGSVKDGQILSGKVTGAC